MEWLRELIFGECINEYPSFIAVIYPGTGGTFRYKIMNRKTNKTELILLPSIAFPSAHETVAYIELNFPDMIIRMK